MKYEPRIGTEFPISKEIVAATTHQITELTRSTIALAFLSFGGLALALAAIYCIHKEDFQVLLTLWAVLAAPLGAIVYHYFPGRNLDGKNDDESPA
jgi:hypothetical protein